MFGKKDSKDSAEEKKIDNLPNNLMSVRGALTAQVKFRGYLCITLLLITIVSLACCFMSLSRRQVIIGIDSSGVPSYMKEVVANINYDVFIRDFAGHFTVYTAETVDKNLKYAMARTTDNFKKSLRLNYEQELAAGVKEFEVTQILTIKDVKIIEMNTAGISAELKAEKLRSDKLMKKVIPEDIYVKMRIVRGEQTEQNPWGLYVDVWQESRVE